MSGPHIPVELAWLSINSKSECWNHNSFANLLSGQYLDSKQLNLSYFESFEDEHIESGGSIYIYTSLDQTHKEDMCWYWMNHCVNY